MYVDKRLSGIQAVQTLSRLNRAHPGKDTTYILDFVNDPDEILGSFQPYYETAELAGVTDPELVYTLRAQLDATGYYDENAVNRVAEVELDPNAKQSELVAAIHPVADRLLKQYQEARKRLLLAQSLDDIDGEQKARDEMDALVLFRRNMGTYVRVYAFLSQIFDYGNTEIEKRAIFFRRLIPLLEFGREREEVDLSKVKLTHHSLRDTGTRQLKLGGEIGKLQPLQEAGSGEVHAKEKALLGEIIRAVNELFDGDVTEDDKLVYVDTVKTKLMESEILVQQAQSNTKEQFANSPDLHQAVMNAIMDALSAHSTMSKQALDSAEVRAGLTRILLGPANLYEHLRAQSGGSPPA
jgi:type I restriction enzyme, R subunit